MSNYDWKTDPSGLLIIGAEEMNGTGNVVIKSADCDDFPFYGTCSWDEAIAIGELIIAQAERARKRQEYEEQSYG